MSFLEGAGLELGIGIAIGMLAGTTGTRGSARGRMTVLAAAIGLVAGFLLAGAADLSRPLGALLCMAAAALACLVISDVVSGATRRRREGAAASGGGGGALGFLVSLAALVVVAAALLLPVLTLLALLGLAWLGAARHRRAQRKHAGLRVLR